MVLSQIQWFLKQIYIIPQIYILLWSCFIYLYFIYSATIPSWLHIATQNEAICMSLMTLESMCSCHLLDIPTVTLWNVLRCLKKWFCSCPVMTPVCKVPTVKPTECEETNLIKSKAELQRLCWHVIIGLSETHVRLDWSAELSPSPYAPPSSFCGLVTVTKLGCPGQGFVSHTSHNKDPITAVPLLHLPPSLHPLCLPLRPASPLMRW